MKFICFNGEIIEDAPVFTAGNRGFRYGDGVFETIKVVGQKILLQEYHFDRLFTSLALLKIIPAENFTRENLSWQILELCRKNNYINSARVRIAVYREEDNKMGFVIEAFSLDEKVNHLNGEGWSITVFPLARKTCDAYANLKSANYLLYVLAELYAKEKNCEEAIVLNSDNHLCDASKANIFLVIGDEVHTPALHQGCVNGVKRRFIIEELKKQKIAVHQRIIEEKTLLEADEVFLTNAINDIRWVKCYRDKTYQNNFIRNFYSSLFSKAYDTNGLHE
jgi:branched-chain amino acid aminotransferase